MTREELNRLISLGEGQTLEFKRSASEDFGREMVAFANSMGGIILIGIDNNGLVVGVEQPNRIKGQIQSTARNLEPPLRVQVETVDSVMVVTVPQSSDSPHSSSGRFYLREGASCQQMTRSQIREYFFREGLLLFDTMINRDFDISKDLTRKSYQAFAKSAGIPPNLDMLDSLRNLKLLTDKGMTNAGALILGRKGSRYLVSATVMCALFQGTSKTKILDQKLFDGDVVSNYRNAMLYLQSHLNTEYIITAVRTNKLELPEEALREAIINAIAHRDYRSPANIQIFIFYDRVEIHNPGGLVAGLKIADLGKRSVPRNPLLFGMLYRMDLVEHVGSGLKRIRGAMKEYGLEAPVIEADEHWFSVTFMRMVNKERKVDESKIELAGTQKSNPKSNLKSNLKILHLLSRNPEMTRADLSEAIGLSLEGVKKNIRLLRKQGRLRRTGPSKGGHWEVQ
jgi:ATP-dependent DNA helicase RecG